MSVLPSADTDAPVRISEESDRLASRFLTVSDIESLPDPEFMIEGVLPEGALAILFGTPEVGKTFLALDLALHIALGIKWCGREVKRGNVLYLIAEGAPGFKLRLAAWKAGHEEEVEE